MEAQKSQYIVYLRLGKWEFNRPLKTLEEARECAEFVRGFYPGAQLTINTFLTINQEVEKVK